MGFGAISPDAMPSSIHPLSEARRAAHDRGPRVAHGPGSGRHLGPQVGSDLQCARGPPRDLSIARVKRGDGAAPDRAQPGGVEIPGSAGSISGRLVVQERAQELLLVPEVHVERALAHAGFGTDVVDGERRWNPSIPDASVGGVDQGLDAVRSWSHRRDAASGSFRVSGGYPNRPVGRYGSRPTCLGTLTPGAARARGCRRLPRGKRARRGTGPSSALARASSRIARPRLSARVPRAVERTCTARASSGSGARATKPSRSSPSTSRVIVGGSTCSACASSPIRIGPPNTSTDRRQTRRRDTQRLVLHAQTTQEVDRGRVQPVGYRVHISRWGSPS